MFYPLVMILLSLLLALGIFPKTGGLRRAYQRVRDGGAPFERNNSDEKLVDIIRENFYLRPAGIIKMLDLRRPIYKQTAAYGHFGRNDLDLSWEKTDKAEALKQYLK